MDLFFTVLSVHLRCRPIQVNVFSPIDLSAFIFIPTVSSSIHHSVLPSALYKQVIILFKCTLLLCSSGLQQKNLLCQLFSLLHQSQRAAAEREEDSWLNFSVVRSGRFIYSEGNINKMRSIQRFSSCCLLQM